jgi:hypothetical protein
LHTTIGRLIKPSEIAEILGPISLITHDGRIIPLDDEDLKNWDLKFEDDLEWGGIGEDFVKDVFSKNKCVEVKTERGAGDNNSGIKWTQSGNILIEFSYRGQPSGIKATKASCWVHLLCDETNEIIGGFIFKTEWLKKRLKELKEKEKLRLVKCGDFSLGRGVLVSVRDIFKDD